MRKASNYKLQAFIHFSPLIVPRPNLNLPTKNKKTKPTPQPKVFDLESPKSQLVLLALAVNSKSFAYKGAASVQQCSSVCH